MVAPVMTATDLRVAEVTAPEQIAAASQLYRDVFGYTKPESTLNPRLLMALAANGGSMVGAWDDTGDLVAFGYGFTGHAGGETYFYSQAVVVSDRLQGTGVGRLMKLEQRRLALAAGLHRMRWAYNPVLSRNAHFNLDVLGAVGRWFAADCYGDGESRLVVEWDLDGGRGAAEAPVTGYDASDWGRIDTSAGLPAVPLPAEREDVTPAVNARVDDAFVRLLGSGLAAVGCTRQDARTAVYRFAEVPR